MQRPRSRHGAMATALAFVLLAATAAAVSGLSLQNQTITSAPVIYGCGFYTMSYKLWCDPNAVTSYVALFSDCWLANPSAAQNGGSSSLLNSSTMLLPSGLVAAPSCPPATGFAQMSCALRTTCTVEWPGPDSNNQQLCLLLVAGTSIGTACDLSIGGQTSQPAAAPPSSSSGVEDMTWWQVLLIVVAGLLALLLGIALLICSWRLCCRGGMRGGGDASAKVAPAAPKAGSRVSEKAASSVLVTNASLPPELALAPAAAILKIYSQRLRDKTLDDPNLFVPDEKNSILLGRPSTVLPGAVHSGKHPGPESDLKSDARSKSAAPAVALEETISEPKARSASQPPPTSDPGPTPSSAPAAQQAALAAAAASTPLPPPPAPLPHAAAPPTPTPAAPPAPPPALPLSPQMNTPGYPPNPPLAPLPPPAAATAATFGAAAAAGAAATAAVAGQQQQQPQPQQPQQVTQSKSLFARVFSKKNPKGTAPNADGPGASARSAAAQPQPAGLQPEGAVSRAPVPSPGEQPPPPPVPQGMAQPPYMPYNPHQQQYPGPGPLPWPGPSPPDGFGQQQQQQQQLLPYSQDGSAHMRQFPASPPGAHAMEPPGLQAAMMQPPAHQPYQQQSQPYQQQPQPYRQQQSFSGHPPPPTDPLGPPPSAAGLRPPASGVSGFESFAGAQPQHPQQLQLQQPSFSGAPATAGAPYPYRGAAGFPNPPQSQEVFSANNSPGSQHGALPSLAAPGGAPPPPYEVHPAAGGFRGEEAYPGAGHVSRQASTLQQQQQSPSGAPPELPPQRPGHLQQQQPQPHADDGPMGRDFTAGGAGARAEPPPGPLLRSPSALSAGGAAAPWPPEPQDGTDLGPPRQQLQLLQPLKPPEQGLQPLQPLPSLRNPPVQTASGMGDSGDDPWPGPRPAVGGDDDHRPGPAAAAAAPVDPLGASLSSAPPRGLPAPLPLASRPGALAPLGGPAAGGIGGGGGGLPPPRPPPGGLAPLAPLPGPRKLTPVARKPDDDDDDDFGAAVAGGTSLRGEPSFGDERKEVKDAALGPGGGGGGGLEDVEDDFDLDRPAPPRRGGFV